MYGEGRREGNRAESDWGLGRASPGGARVDDGHAISAA